MKQPKKLAAMLAVAMMFSAVPQAALAAEVEGANTDASTDIVAQEEAPAEEEAIEDEVAPDEEEPAEEASEEEDEESSEEEEPADEEEVIVDEDDEAFAPEEEEADVEEAAADEEEIVVDEATDAFEAVADDIVPIDETTFPDANFRAFVIENFGIELVQDYWCLDDEKVAQTTTLDLSGKQIANLKGIEYFENLTSLNVSIGCFRVYRFGSIELFR